MSNVRPHEAMQSITVRRLVRSGTSSPDASKIERVSADFVVAGESLLSRLVEVDGGHGDFMGCFVSGFTDENLKKFMQLARAAKPDTDDGRYLLYVCPECGDIGCGAYAAKVRISSNVAEWHDFAYENGYESARVLPSVGPFKFNLVEYMATLEAAREA